MQITFDGKAEDYLLAIQKDLGLPTPMAALIRCLAFTRTAIDLSEDGTVVLVKDGKVTEVPLKSCN